MLVSNRACFALVSVFVVCSFLMRSIGQAQSRPEAAAQSQSVTTNKLPDEIHELAVEVLLQYRSNDGGFFYAPIELPSLEGGRKYKVRIRLNNPTDTSISFSRVVADCSCMKHEIKVNTIEPHSHADFFLHIDAPTVGRAGEVYSGIEFINGETSRMVLKVHAKYTLNNVFSLPSDRLTLEIPNDLPIVSGKVPITLVPPLTIQDLELRVGANLRDLTVSLEEEDGMSFLAISAPRQVVEHGGVMDEIVVKRRGSDRVWSMIVDVRRQVNIKISPQSLRFTPVDGKVGIYEATSLIKISLPRNQPSLEDVESDKKEQLLSEPEVSVTVGGADANLSIRRLGRSGIYRVTVRLSSDANLDLDDDIGVKWFVRNGSEELVVESNAFFSK